MRDRKNVYLDHNATSPLRPVARQAMLQAFEEGFANPSSIHGPGQRASRILEEARQQVAGLLGAEAREVVFVGSGTEAANLAIQGVARRARRRKVALSAIEHPAVSRTCQRLAEEGWQVVELPVTRLGVLDLEAAAELLDESTALVCVMAANNEVGTLQPVREVAELARRVGALVYCDAVQAFGRVPLSVQGLGVDILGVSAHKLGGPKGIGALWIRRGVDLAPVLFGGGQERGLRPGTQNVPAAAGFGAVCEYLQKELPEEAGRLAGLRDRLEALLEERVSGVRITAKEAPRLPNTTNLSVGSLEADVLQVHLDLAGFAVSTTSACSSGAARPSRVLQAMGAGPAEAMRTIRISLGWNTRPEDIEAVV